MQYAYEKLMSDEKLTLAELPEDAKIGIEAIKKIERMLVISEKKGRKPTAKVLNKLKANDKWVVREILDYMEGKDSKQSEEVPHSVEEVQQDIKTDETKDEVKVDEKGLAIDKELQKLIEENTTTLTANELKAKAPRTYAVIFDNYEKGKENGVETSFYKAIETEAEKFTISKI